jgi:murein tripeptide amidase MpaA
VLTARVHPCESNSSFVLKGLMDEYCSEESQAGEFLRDNYVFIVVPMLNPDGVSIGNSRSSLSGYDLNKCWSNPDRMVHPEIFYTKKLLDLIQK